MEKLVQSLGLKGDFGDQDLFLLAHFRILASSIICHQFPDEEKAVWPPLYYQTDQCWI